MSHSSKEDCHSVSVEDLNNPLSRVAKEAGEEALDVAADAVVADGVAVADTGNKEVRSRTLLTHQHLLLSLTKPELL